MKENKKKDDAKEDAKQEEQKEDAKSEEQKEGEDKDRHHAAHETKKTVKKNTN